MGNHSEVAKQLQALQNHGDTLSSLIYGYVLAIDTGKDSRQIALGIDALLDEVREQFDSVSELVGGAE